MLPKNELLAKMAEYEARGAYNEEVEPHDNAKIKKLTPKYKYIKRGFFAACARAIALFACLVCNRFWTPIKVRGRKNLKGIKRAVATCNHVNNMDNIMVREAVFGHKLYITVAEFNNLKGFIGGLMRHAGCMAFSSSFKTMQNLSESIKHLLKNENCYVLFYPEHSLWWNYKKPRPFQPGAFHYAAAAGVPVVPLFITFEPKNRKIKPDSAKITKNTWRKIRFVVNIMEPIYPNSELPVKEAASLMLNQNYEMCCKKYQEVYGEQPLLNNKSNAAHTKEK